MTWEEVKSAALGVSVTLNVALFLRGYQLTRLEHHIDTVIGKERHRYRGWLGAVVLEVGHLRMAHNQMAIREHPQRSKDYIVPEPPPFDEE